MIAGIVLAGGQSSRMGCDKSQLKLAGIPLINHSKNILDNSGIKNVFISGKYGILDQHTNLGPLAGIFASLEYLSSFKHVIFIPVDMPLLNKKIVKYIIENKNSQAIYIENYYFPLMISNTKTNREIISKQLTNNLLSINGMLTKLNAKVLKNQFSKENFLNANTEKDWNSILKAINKND